MCEGVDLAALEAVPGVPNFLIKLDVEREIEPLVRFLSDACRLALSCATGPALDSPAREPTQVGTVLQAAPRLLQVSIEVLSSIDPFYSYVIVNCYSSILFCLSPALCSLMIGADHTSGVLSLQEILVA